MKKLIIFFSLLLVFLNSSAQPDYNIIKNKISSPDSSTFYPKLEQRFVDSDSTLRKEDFYLLYYGGVFSKNYTPQEITEKEKVIRLANYSGEYLQAYELADSLLKIYPVSIQAYFEKAYACHNLKRFDEEEYNRKRYKLFIKIILSSGDGKSLETAWHVNLMNDEYEVLQYLQLLSIEETEIEYSGKVYDVISLKPNKLKLKNIYFDISRQTAAGKH
jgi:hypothetical protein